jgi:LmbE family N-acetylglucosaminyl deacetylase
MNHNHYTPKRAIVIVAHPDDIEFGCAGTVAQWVQDGAEICYVLCTSGAMREAGNPCARAAEIREAEQVGNQVGWRQRGGLFA